MKAQLESTAEIVTVNGVRARVWRGTTDAGVAFEAYVAMVRVRKDADNAQFEAELRSLQPQLDPGPIDMRFIV